MLHQAKDPLFINSFCRGFEIVGSNNRASGVDNCTITFTMSLIRFSSNAEGVDDRFRLKLQ